MATLEKTTACLFSYLKVQIIANSGLPVAPPLHFDTAELSHAGKQSAGQPTVAFHLFKVVCEMFEKRILRGVSVQYFTFLSTKLLQLLSRLRRDTRA